jgi:uncharacterized protein YfkK (UPF0435 family)
MSGLEEKDQEAKVEEIGDGMSDKEDSMSPGQALALALGEESSDVEADDEEDEEKSDTDKDSEEGDDDSDDDSSGEEEEEEKDGDTGKDNEEEEEESGEAKDKEKEKAEGEGETDTDSVKLSKSEYSALRSAADEVENLKEKLNLLVEKVSAHSKKVDEQLLDPDDIEEGREKEETDFDLTTDLDTIQEKLSIIAEENGVNFRTQLLSLAAQEDYSDIYDVCSDENYQYIVKAGGAALAQELGIPRAQAEGMAKLHIWESESPYERLYDLVTKHHPSYAKKEDSGKEGSEGEKDKDGKTPKKKLAKRKKPVTDKDAPGSVEDVSGGDNDDKTGWTAKRIDSMDEMELMTVPKDVYRQYMAGELK